MLLMYNRTYAAEIGMFGLIPLIDCSVCCGCKETVGDRREGKEARCRRYQWQCAVDKGRSVDVVNENVRCNIDAYDEQCTIML